MNQTRVRAEGVSPGLIVGLGLLIVALYVSSLFVLMDTATFDAWGALIVGPLLVAISLPILAREAGRAGDRRLLWLLLFALILKLGGALVRYYVAFDVYGGTADASVYHREGVRLSENFRTGDFATGLESLTGTNFITLVVGILYTFMGPTILGGFLVFSWMGFLGLFLFYRAFTVAVPEGRVRSYAHLVFFLPSLLFWPSSTGKESWMMLSLGLAAFGAARILGGRRMVRGLVLVAVGLLAAAAVRPHVAGLMGVALAGSIVLWRVPDRLRRLAPIVKLASIAMLGALAVVLVLAANRFLKDVGIDTGAGLESALGQITERTGQGGSEFAPSVLTSPSRAPIALVTVLFRPLVFEAHNLQALAAATEATFVLLLSLFRIRWVLEAARSVRRYPYVAFAMLYTAGFVVAYSSVANFGLLARQRVQVWPLYLVLLSIPPRRAQRSREPARARAAAGT